MLSRNVFHRRPTAYLNSFSRSLATDTVPEASSTAPLPQIRTKRPQRPQLNAAIILNRSPFLTRTPTLFERAYYAYQARIRRSLHNPFPLDFYFKQGSLLETSFSMEEKKRERRAFGPTFGVDGFISKEKAAAQKAAADQLALQEGDTEGLMQRVHVSDTNREFKSLDRKGRRNIYLLLRTMKDTWRFPEGGAEKGELLHQAAQRYLHIECGSNMDTWIVSRNPVGFYRPSLPVESPDETDTEKITFFFKAHIMAGQAVLSLNSVQDFAWLTKQEIQRRVSPEYWDGVKDILSEY